MNTLQGFEGALRDGSIRKTPDNEVAVIDVIQHLAGKTYAQSKQTYKWIKSRHLELGAFTYTYSFGVGRPSAVMTIQGIIQLIMVLPGLKAGKFRQDAARLICRYMAADITLADDILQRNQNPEDAKWLEERAKGKVERLALTDTIQSHGGERHTYIAVSEINNRAITGMPAKEIQRVRGVKKTRDGLTTGEVIAMGFTEHLEASEIDNRNAFSHTQISSVAADVASDVKTILSKYSRKEISAEAEAI